MTDELCSLCQGVSLADVKDLEVVLYLAYDGSAMARGEIEVDDAEPVWKTAHQGKQAWGERVYAREGIRVERLPMLRQACAAYVLVR